MKSIFFCFFIITLFSGLKSADGKNMEKSQDFNKRINSIRKEFYHIEKMKMGSETCSAEVIYEGAQADCTSFSDKPGNIRKLSVKIKPLLSDGKGFPVAVDEYFLDDGNLFFIYIVESGTGYRNERRVYLWMGKVILNLYKEMIFTLNSHGKVIEKKESVKETGEFNFDTSPLKVHRNAHSIKIVWSNDELDEHDGGSKTVRECIRKCPKGVMQCVMTCKGGE